MTLPGVRCRQRHEECTRCVRGRKSREEGWHGDCPRKPGKPVVDVTVHRFACVRPVRLWLAERGGVGGTRDSIVFLLHEPLRRSPTPTTCTLDFPVSAPVLRPLFLGVPPVVPVFGTESPSRPTRCNRTDTEAQWSVPMTRSDLYVRVEDPNDPTVDV